MPQIKRIDGIYQTFSPSIPTKHQISPKRITSILLILLLTLALVEGLLFSPPLLEASGGGTLTNVVNTPTNTQVSTTTSHQIRFTTQTAIPTDGKILITFPSGFDASSTSFSSWSGFDGGQSVSVAGQTVIVQRDGAGTQSSPGAKSITLSNILNPSTASTITLSMLKQKIMQVIL